MTNIKQLPTLIININSDDKDIVLNATISIRKLLSANKPNITAEIEAVIKSGVIPKLVSFLYLHEEPLLQFESAWALTNVTSGTKEQTQVVVDNDVIDIFIKLLYSPNDDVREQAIWGLRNIASDSYISRDLILDRGGLPPLLNIIQSILNNINSIEASKIDATTRLIRTATSMISNLSKNNPLPPLFENTKLSIPILAQLIHYNDIEVLKSACWALSYISDGTEEQIQSIINANIVPKLIELLDHPEILVLSPALRTIGNLLTGSVPQAQIMINLSILPHISKIINSKRVTIRKEACWLISNITAESIRQIQCVIDEGLIQPLIFVLENDIFEAKKEAAYAISNAISFGSLQQIDFIVNKGCIKPLCDILLTADLDIILVDNILKSIERIIYAGKYEEGVTGINKNILELKDVGGFTKVNLFNNHTDNDIFSKVIRIQFYNK